MRYLSFLAAHSLAVLISASGAWAEMLPAYDPETLCSDLAGTSVKQEVVMRGCLDFQERTRKEVALTWDKVPAPVQDACVKAVQESGDYWRLKSCIDKGISADSR